MADLQDFAKKWNKIQWEKWNELALAIQEDCKTIITKIEAVPFELNHDILNHLSNAKYALHLCRSDATEDLEIGELHPDWNEVYLWTEHFFHHDFFVSEEFFTFPMTKKVWLELTNPSVITGKCWYCGDLDQELNKDGMCFLCSLK